MIIIRFYIFFFIISSHLRYFSLFFFNNYRDCNSISWIKAQSNVPVVMFTGFNPDDLSVYQKVNS